MCSSNWPTRFAKRCWSSGTSTTSVLCSAALTSGNGPPCRIAGEASAERIRLGLRGEHVDEASNGVRGDGKIAPAVVFGSAAQLAARPLRRPLDEHTLHRSDHAPADRGRLPVDERLQALETRLLDCVRDRVLDRCSRRAGTRAVDEAERLIEADALDQCERRGEVLYRLTGEADDEIRRH